MLVCILDTLSNYLTLYFYSHTIQVRHKSYALKLLLFSVSSKKVNNNKTPPLLPEEGHTYHYCSHSSLGDFLENSVPSRQDFVVLQKIRIHTEWTLKKIQGTREASFLNEMRGQPSALLSYLCPTQQLVHWGQQQPAFHPRNLLCPSALNRHMELQGLAVFPLPRTGPRPHQTWDSDAYPFPSSVACPGSPWEGALTGWQGVAKWYSESSFSWENRGPGL